MSTASAPEEAALAYSRHRVGWGVTESLIDCAVRLLEAGADTPELRLMAGMNRNESPVDLREAFERVLGSLGVDADRLDIPGIVGRDVCRSALEGTMRPFGVATEMYALWLASDHDPAFDRWMRLADSRDLLRGGDGPLEPFFDLTLETFDATVLEEAQRFLREHPHTRGTKA